MSEIDQKIVTSKLCIERLTNELMTETVHLLALGMEKQKMLENVPCEEVSSNA